jgi:hypothetical protein
MMTAPDIAGQPIAEQRIAEQRLRQQCLTGTPMRQPAQVVAWLGAIQAQEYLPAKWGLSLRLSGAVTNADLEAAVSRGDILRTHVLRPTWHFVAPADIRWMLALTGPRVQRAMGSYVNNYGIDAPTLTRTLRIIERALAGRSLTRADLGIALARRGIAIKGAALKGTALALVTIHAEAEGLICSGPYQGRHLTYALLDERVPKAPMLSRDEAVGELALRFFQSHGPATLRDFAWWSGLTMADGRRGLGIVRGRQHEADGLTYWTVGPVRAKRSKTSRVHLLPIYDEYTVAYRDRKAIPHAGFWATARSAAGEVVTFQHTLVIDGGIAGTWRTTKGRERVSVDVTPLRTLTAAERRAVAIEIERYTRFVAS